MLDPIIALTIALVAYFIGNCNPSIIISQHRGEDIRNMGSGNAGTTNVVRTYGWSAGMIVGVVDLLKGIIAAVIGQLCAIALLGDYLLLTTIAGLAVILGHIFPALHKFRGGKGVFSAFGFALVLNWTYALIALGVFLVTVLISRYVSLGSIIAIVVFVAIEITSILSASTCPDNIIVALLLVLILGITTWSHRSNITRLLNRTENKFGQKKA